MPRQNGVSRKVKVSQPGPFGRSQSTLLNQPAVARIRESAAKRHLDFINGTVLTSRCLNVFSFNVAGLGDKSQRVLSEFNGSSLIEPPPSSTEPGLDDAQDWETLNQDGVTQGFLDDIQGLLSGK
jgi:hypothetical protein